jgi:hypothetical protein
MRTVRLCAIIAIGVAFGYAFDDAADNGLTKLMQASVRAVAGK